MDHPFGRKFAAMGDFRLAGRTAAERAAFFEQLRAGRAMNRIAPSTPPPPSNVVFAAFTIASTRCFVMSPSTTSILFLI
jgi:hypothetical protein